MHTAEKLKDYIMNGRNDLMNNGSMGLLNAVYPQEDWGLVYSTVFTGLFVVFIILGILIGIIFLMGKAIGSEKKKQKNAKPAAVSADVVKAVSTPPETVTVPAHDGGEIIAVIAAAVAAIGAAEGKKLKITGIREKSKPVRSSWSRAGIMENTQPKG